MILDYLWLFHPSKGSLSRSISINLHPSTRNSHVNSWVPSVLSKTPSPAPLLPVKRPRRSARFPVWWRTTCHWRTQWWPASDAELAFNEHRQVPSGRIWEGFHGLWGECHGISEFRNPNQWWLEFIFGHPNRHNELIQWTSHSSSYFISPAGSSPRECRDRDLFMGPGCFGKTSCFNRGFFPWFSHRF